MMDQNFKQEYYNDRIGISSNEPETYSRQGTRPLVNPQAEGVVDPNLYPEPKEATHKIRSKNDIIEYLFGTVDQELLTVKTFYFFFYSAFGSLFPLMGVYFKQMGMNAAQCGLLIGIRPLIEFLSAPFWGSLADRWQKGKLILLLSLSCWILFTLPIGFIQPPVTTCMIIKNHTEVLEIPISDQKVVKRSLINKFNSNYNETGLESNSKNEIGKIKKPVLIPNKLQITHYNMNQGDKIDEVDRQFLSISKTMRSFLNRNINLKFQKTTAPRRFQRNAQLSSLSVGQSPLAVTHAKNYNSTEHKGWVKPIFSSIVYKLSDIQKTFFLLLLMVIVGEFLSAPAITLADSAVITLLGEDADRYGHQRMFGSLGWGLAMFFVGIALDHSTAFPDHPCTPNVKEKNYTICFAIFSVLMGAALITSTQISFKYEQVAAVIETTTATFETSEEDQLQFQLSEQLKLPGLQNVAGFVNTKPPQEEKTKMFAQTIKEIPEWITVLKQFKDIKCASFLFVAWFMGFGIGLIFTFLFWHLQDYGGTPTLFGVASVINHISEIFAYFFSFKLIRQLGHVKVLCLGLAGNVLRFLYVSWLKNPWWVLPFELMQGITHAAVWAACCSYIAHNTPDQLRSSAQGVLQGLHHGLGRGCGAVIGGMFVASYGTATTFRIYGLICFAVLVVFVFINFYRKDSGFVSELPQNEDPHQVAEVTHLAPHGVPSNAIPRALSSNRLHELGNQDISYGATYQSSNYNLDIPYTGSTNPNNPFLKNTTLKEEADFTRENGSLIKTEFQMPPAETNLKIMKLAPLLSEVYPQNLCRNPFHQHSIW